MFGLGREINDAAKTLIGQKVLLIGHSARPVLIVSIEQKGVILAQVCLEDGSLQEMRLTTQEIDGILKPRVADQQKSQQFAATLDLRLLIESHNIYFAYAYDPLFAVGLSGIRYLPHQIEAVYDLCPHKHDFDFYRPMIHVRERLS